MRLYVGNLKYGIDDQALREAFEEFGQVIDVKVMIDRETGRSRGFGFIEMNDADAENAIAEMNGKMLDGRALVVNEARERQPRGGGDGGGYGGGRGGGRDRY